MKTFNDLARECAEYADKANKKFRQLAYLGFGICLLSAFMIFLSIYSIIHPKPTTRLWLEIALIVWNYSIIVFMVYNGVKCLNYAKERWNEWMKERQKCLDLAQQYRDF